MASEKTPAASVYTASAVKLSEIHADYGWNVRAERNVQDMADTESSGFDGFVANMHVSGQITPIILRNTKGVLLNGSKTDKPFEVVCGFRRHRAITILNGEHRHMVGISGELAGRIKKNREEGKAAVPNLPSGTILAEVRDVGDVTHARILNGQENTARKNLKAQDLVFLVSDLNKAGMAQVPIAESLGISQGWVSRLLKVAALPAPVLAHWRMGSAIAPVTTKDGVYGLSTEQVKTVKRELTEPDMRSLAELKNQTAEDWTARYIRMISPEEQGEGPGTTEETDKMLKKVVDIASMMGCMVRAGLLYPDGDKTNLDWNRVIGPKGKGYPIEVPKGEDTQDRLIQLADAAQDVFDKEVSKNVNPNVLKTGNAKGATQPS